MTRPLLDPKKISPEALAKVRGLHTETIDEIEKAIAAHDVVVVGMAQNPHVRKVRAELKEAGIAFEYLEYGSYLSEWRRRLAIKLWSGWPTFPQVFVRGELIGGEDLTRKALEDGSLKAKLGAADVDGAAATA
ncbi:MAG: glutaredoxin [Myxococcales bacterium]|nr:glutaredoxin [Myxococcales bacterium]